MMEAPVRMEAPARMKGPPMVLVAKVERLTREWKGVAEDLIPAGPETSLT